MEVDDTTVVDQGEAWIQDHFACSRTMSSVEACSWTQRWLLDPFGRFVARMADTLSRIIASRKQRRASPNYAFSSRILPDQLSYTEKRNVDSSPSRSSSSDST